MRKRKRNRNKGGVRLVLGVALCLLCVMTVGYSAFSTNVSLSAKGNIKDNSISTIAETITELVSDTTANLITDDYGNIRYSGLNVNNYVCMENEVTCSEDNLYRIIGVFNNIKTSEDDVEGESRIKLIKATNNGNAYWNNSTRNNNWTEASLKNTLNSASTPIYSSSLIDDAVWNIGGHTTGEVTTKDMYNYERGNTTGNSNAYPTTWTGKVALMYPSDYGYASSSCYSTKNLGGGSPDYRDSDCTGSNWLFPLDTSTTRTTSPEWLLTPYSGYSDFVFMVYAVGIVGTNGVYYSSSAVRPAVYLKSNVKIKEDSERNGSEEHPYLLELIEEKE